MQKLPSKNISWAPPKHVFIVTVVCDYVGSRKLQRELPGPWHSEDLAPAPLHVLFLPVFLLLISAGQTEISSAGEGDNGCEHFVQSTKKKAEATSGLPGSSPSQSQVSSKNKTVKFMILQ